MMNESTTPPVPVSTPAQTRRALLGDYRRGYTSVRGLLVQKAGPDPVTGSRASTLARCVRERAHHDLILYLLLLGSWHGALRHTQDALASDVWIRALTAEGYPHALTWSKPTLSRTWSRLERQGLIVRERRGRYALVTPRREDAAADYAAPEGVKDESDEWYFTLPNAFWEDDIFAKLRLPGLAMLLLFLKETNKKSEFQITLDNVPTWYGISRRSAQNGIRELRDARLLETRRELVPAPLSPTGVTERMHYSLLGVFSTESRAEARRHAAAARKGNEAGDAAS